MIQRRLSLVSKSAAIVAPAPGQGDPTQLGGVLRVANPLTGDDDVRYRLPASGWTGVGRPAGAKGYQYTDKRGANGPCTSVLVEPGKKIDATCAGSGFAFTLNEPAQELVAASLTLGDDPTLCMQFGGVVKRDVPAQDGTAGLFKAEDAPPPESCPLP